ncbi:MAG: LPS assembly lipoprotein LptE [Gammaproteobacteria bacterium]|nr:LPS assembly lipoprotein LptE [Gammaproteobacteria bacterium]
MLRYLFALFLCMSVAGCGFQLRGTSGDTLTLERVHVGPANRFPELRRELERQLRQNGTDIVAESDAATVLELVEQRTGRRPVTSTGSGSTARYELDLEVTFSVRRADSVLLAPTALSSQRTYSFDPESLVGNSEEEELLTSEMRRDVAFRILRHVDAVVRDAAEAGP